MVDLVSTKEYDYLDEDKQIKNQNYCLLSFISPEEVIKNKESYYVTAFLDKFSKDMNTLFNGLKNVNPDNIDLIDNIRKEHNYLFDINDLDSQYKFSKTVNESDVERLYHKENDFQTSMRGIKVRGVFDTIEEAKRRSEFLKKLDKNHNIFIGQVGCWCPWSPNPDDLDNQEYSETQLNTLMKEYKKNQESKDEIFEKRREDNIKTKLDDVEESTAEVETKMSELDTVFTEKDPWTQKQESKQ
tara:strand:- start:1024 stop:1752 length:729 start_codon:yes stop_codon:yes gene_type:complete